MRRLTSVLIVIVVILAIVVGALYFLYMDENGPLKSTLNAKVLVLCADPSEQRPGVGGMDMAFVVDFENGNVKNLTPIYPGGMSHPTAAAPEGVGLSVLMLHDTLWTNDTTYGAQLAQETVEYNTGIKTDVVVIVTPEAIDAVLQSIGGVNVPGQGLVQGNSLEFLRDEQDNGGMSRGSAIESLGNAIKSAAQDKSKRSAITNAIIGQYNAGTIIVVPNDFAYRFITAEGLNKVFG
ncbi:MAG TPA: DUF4012 domain-containing protein [Methanobacterium sp.]